MPGIKFDGTVNTGQGNGKFFVKLPWVTRQLTSLFGFIPYLGTLNLRLTPESTKRRTYLTQQNGILIKPENGYLSGYLYKATISNTDCYVVLPDVPNYPKDLLEIIAAKNLRDLLNVKDGDKIVVMVQLQN
ncbi:MAG: CTP-dependent riboflavin kinase [Nitrososphaerota archaeon]|nr:CTP-dependent riboflavin kinase [Nitrososphaerota archaeon]